MGDEQLIYEAYQSGVVLKETRAMQTNLEEVCNIIKTKCRENFDYCYRNNVWLYRGTSTYKDYYIMYPDQHHRKPMTNDYALHNWVLANLENWSEYPDRSKSIVGATDIKIASAYGMREYIMIPYDGVKIGICPEEDLFQSFPGTEAVYGHKYAFDGFIEFLRLLHMDIKGGFDEWCKGVDNALNTPIKDEPSVLGPPVNWINLIKRAKEAKGEMGMKEFLAKLLDPNTNGFSIVDKMEEIPWDKKREVWWSGPTILVKLDKSNAGNFININNIANVLRMD